MKHDKKNVSKLLANLIISSFAISGGVVPSSAMEQQQERVPTQNELCDALAGLDNEAAGQFIEHSIRFLRMLIGGWETINLNNNFYRNFKKSVVIAPEKEQGEILRHFHYGPWIRNEDYEHLEPRFRIYFKALQDATDAPLGGPAEDIFKMLVAVDEKITMNPGSNSGCIYARDYEPPIKPIKKNPLMGYNIINNQNPVKTLNPDICPICLAEFSDGEDDQSILTTPCKHSYHEDCLDQLARSKRKEPTDPITCPICKMDLDPGSVLRRSNTVI